MTSLGPRSPAHPYSLALPSGLTIHDPHGRLLRFSREEYDYYDGIVGSAPDRIEPLDVLVTWSVNSNIYRVDPGKTFMSPAAKMREIHRSLAARCDPILPEIPEDADLLTFDPGDRTISKILREAVRVPGVSVSVATKVLHRKRRSLIPMLDSVVCKHYLSASEIASLED